MATPCTIDGCDRDAVARGWCLMHYKRWRRNGDPTVLTVQPAQGLTCSVDGCSSQVRARGWCDMHYQRWRSHGDPNVRLPMGPAPTPLLSRRTIDEETGCWIFNGSRSADGYGHIRYQGRPVRIHRLAAHLWLGFDLDDPRFILHSCDNPPCFNPEHLRPGDWADNAADMVERGRHRPPGIRGDNHWNTRIPEADVPTIRARHAAGETQSAIAREYGVLPSTISRIVNRKRRAA